MRDDEQAARVRGPACLEVAGQPGDRLDVEVVGRLVEEEDVVVASEQGRQRHPASLPARQRAHRAVPRQVGDQAGQHVADLRVTGPLVLRAVADDGGPDGERRVQDVTLLEHAEPDTAAHGHAARVRPEPAREQAQEGRLAVTVAPDDADPIAFGDADGHGVEDDGRRVLQAEGLAAEQVGHG